MRCNRVTLAVVGTAVFFGLAMPARAQRIGMIAGGTFSQLRGLDNVTAKNRTGTMFGASLTLPIGGSTAFQPELLFVNKGSELKIGDVGKKDIRIDYLEIPLLLRFDHNPGSAVGPHLYLGPSMGYKVGFNVGCNVSTILSGGTPASSACADQTFKPKSFDWGAIAGVGVDLNVGGLGVTAGARYGIGLADISHDNRGALEQRVRNGTLTVYGGLLFGRR